MLIQSALRYPRYNAMLFKRRFVRHNIFLLFLHIELLLRTASRFQGKFAMMFLLITGFRLSVRSAGMSLKMFAIQNLFSNVKQSQPTSVLLIQ